MIKNKLVRGVFLAACCLAIAALVSCQSNDGGVVGTPTGNSLDEDWPVYIYGTVRDGSVIPYHPPMEGVLVGVGFPGGEGEWVIIWQDYTDENGYYQTCDLSAFGGRWLTLSAYEEGYGPYSVELYIYKESIEHDIYLYVNP